MNADETANANLVRFEQWLIDEHSDLSLSATQKMWLYGQLSLVHVPPPWTFGDEEGEVAHELWRVFSDEATDGEGNKLYEHPLIVTPNPMLIEEQE